MIAPNRMHDSKLRLRTCPMKTVTLKKPTASSKLGITLTSPETAVGANSLDVATVVTALSDDGIAAQTDRSLLGAELLSVNGTDVYSHDHGTKLLKSSLGRITLRVQPPLRLQEVNLFKPAEATKLGMTLSGAGAPKVSALSGWRKELYLPLPGAGKEASTAAAPTSPYYARFADQPIPNRDAPSSDTRFPLRLY